MLPDLLHVSPRSKTVDRFNSQQHHYFEPTDSQLPTAGIFLIKVFL
jgi:hypothetical protein